ncbi:MULTISPECIES: WD40 repeat domain-containing protein [unclassified Imperialibacter]|uniref:WD40 repeat domain-containing protein n=1 Tax=unclassified Imperialibacter TaxID=2629706 RepID=UPI001253C5AF|nr:MULTISPECIES: WD40 repeat domain-containing protein [unclassified Imperialibacter]CAD5257216.1 conserved hypothetical protein [Imperialibacter sp. 89]CAD5272221.1 conserved hypothetical protein [Imperialibacter sp. 75]VVT32055.1 hypothetical protein IMPR6_60009 [Imperialibacter sp. EC-SDR9]
MQKLIFALLMTVSNGLIAQEEYHLADELIIPKPDDLRELLSGRVYYPAGSSDDNLVYQVNLRKSTKYGLSSEAVGKVFYNELTNEVIDTLSIKKQGRNILSFIQMDGSTLYRGIFQVPGDLLDKNVDELSRGQFLQDFQDFWISSNGSDTKIRSYPEHYYDRDVDYFLDESGKFVVLNEYVSQYLRSGRSDSTVRIFEIDDDEIKQRDLSCIECINMQVSSGKLFFGKKFFYLKGADVYDWKIYSTPLFDLSKSELIAEYIEVLLASPDGKYVLGKKQNYGRTCFVIVDVAAKKFDFIMGRDYSKYKYFYSPGRRQFAFDTESHFIYINYPKEFPFNAIGPEAAPARTTNEEDSEFWAKHLLPSFR